MKTKILCNVLSIWLLVTGVSGIVKSQDCGMYYTMVNGSEYEMTNYDAKDKVDGKTIYKISNVVKSPEGSIALVETTSKDKKDEVVVTSKVSVKCIGGSIFIDMKSYIPATSTEQWKDMDVKTDASSLEIPQTLTPGMTLKDGSVTVSVYNSGTLFQTMKINIINRKVESTETIITPAGTFTCYKITQDIKTEISTMGFNIPINTKSAEYYATGTGCVKSESFDKNDKLVGYSLLTKITKL